MKIVVPVDPDIVNSKLVALNIDNQPVMDFKGEVYGSSEKKLVLEVGGLYGRGMHVMELLTEKGVYKRYAFSL
ncbi:hypothetical protein [Metallosphaera hakonensis]|uniref:Uncharacterized protein n=1 Tax=Metallosphaera hakonensis JCM 8857 = DSM 7519 TaxID=1293036 RepID=A0A2U9IS80_9CREN|nr:hypothetical protein [Metallosphaera hakonensis]AWR98892.1 hypothetical protein DFR87_03380 [Metallosphaera hakonensis JCM 8857 = DSM 7519]